MEYILTREEHARLLYLAKRSFKRAGAPIPRPLQAAKTPAVEKDDPAAVARPPPRTPASELLSRPDFVPSISRRSIRIFAVFFAIGHVFETVLPTVLRRQTFREALSKLRSTSPVRLALFLSSFSAIYRYADAVFGVILPKIALQRLPPRRVPSRPQVTEEDDSSDDEEAPRRSTMEALRPHFRRNFWKLLLSPHVPPALAGVVAAPTILLDNSGSRRVAIALYAFLRSLQYGYSALRDQKWWPDALKTTRWFWGSHIVFALCNAQLLHASLFHPEFVPEQYASLLLRFSDPYLPTKPSYLAPDAKWPSDKQVVAAVGRMTIAKYPSFSSPLLHTTEPRVKDEFMSIKPVLDHLAHPAHSSLMCAVAHPKDISCSSMAKTALRTNATKSSRLLGFLAVVFLVLKRKQMRTNYEKVATEAVRLVIGGTAFLSLFTTIPWASGCALQNYLPASILPTRRFFAQGFLAGLPVMALPAFAVPELTFSLARMSVLSWWGVSVKQKRVKTRSGGEAIYFALAAGIMGALEHYDHGKYIKSKPFRRGLGYLMA